MILNRPFEIFFTVVESVSNQFSPYFSKNFIRFLMHLVWYANIPPFMKFRIGCCILQRCTAAYYHICLPRRHVRRLIFVLCTSRFLKRVLGPCQLCARMGQRLDLSAVCPHMPVPSGLSRLSCCMKL